jgi:hypothetical protein
MRSSYAALDRRGYSQRSRDGLIQALSSQDCARNPERYMATSLNALTLFIEELARGQSAFAEAFNRHMFSLRKEVIQPQVLLRLPCYDFTPIMNHTLDGCPLAVGSPASSATHFTSLLLDADVSAGFLCISSPGKVLRVASN